MRFQGGAIASLWAIADVENYRAGLATSPRLTPCAKSRGIRAPGISICLVEARISTMRSCGYLTFGQTTPLQRFSETREHVGWAQRATFAMKAVARGHLRELTGIAASLLRVQLFSKHTSWAPLMVLRPQGARW